MKDENNPLITRDWWQLKEPKLANERTFLAYFRTFIVILGTGITIAKLEIFSELKSFGIYLIIFAPIILFIGLIRLIRVKRTIRKHYKI